MEHPLPSNEQIVAFGQRIPWSFIEEKKIIFNQTLKEVASQSTDDTFDLDFFSQKLGIPVTAYYGLDEPYSANVILGHYGGSAFILGSVVSGRYRSGKTFSQAIVPYNFNPSVNHTNLEETDDQIGSIRAIGAEIELGLYHPDGSAPKEEEVRAYMELYQTHARRLGITPQVDREACQYQIEAHVAPGIGYNRTRASLEGILSALVMTSQTTGLYTAISAAYPIKSDFHLTDDPKVHTAVDLMVEVNNLFDDYKQRLAEAKRRYHMDPNANVVEVFRLQGCHIHLDLAGRSEALGVFGFYTMLRSATAVANSAVLKGSPFVNGVCDPELLCTREYLRRTTVTGETIKVPLSPHLVEGDLERYASLLKSERANAMARALLYSDSHGTPTSAMHSLIGRMRPDLGSSKRICTLESTGMPVNVSASRQAAVLTDFEFTHALLENYYRKYGTDLNPMMDDKTLWAILGPLDHDVFMALHDESDRLCTDMTLRTAAGTSMSLPEFYEMKRLYMHKHLSDLAHLSPRDIDDVYFSLQRMLNPPSGVSAQVVEQYIYDYKLRSTGNWGRILINTYQEEGGVVGENNPDAVLRVTNRIHEALCKRYTPQ